MVLSPKDQSCCPRCRASLEGEGEYLRWCPQCNWNAEAEQPDRPDGWIERRYRVFGKRLGDRLLSGLMMQTGEDGLVPRWSMPVILALLLSSVLLLVAPLIAVTGILVLALHWPEPLYLVLGAVMLFAAFVLRPRLPSARKHVVQSMSDFPALEAVCVRVSTAKGISPIGRVVIESDFNAWVMQTGARQVPLLGIGVALWSILTPQEQVALLAHESGHLRNRDPLRGLVTANAVHVLDTWDYLLGHDRLNTMDGLTTIGYIPFAVMRKAVAALRHVLLTLTFLESQRAEYFADALARQVAGHAACISLMRKMSYDAHLSKAAEKTYYSGDQRGRGLIATFGAIAAALPSSEIERLRRIGEAEGSRIDSSHPPTASRIRFLAHAPAQPSVTMSEDESGLISKEFAPYIERMSERLMAQYFED